jgi:hypothetical protein
MTMLTDCRATIDGQADASSVPRLVRDVVAGLPADASVEQKILALYRYVRHHLFAYLGTMDDAIEVLNKAVYTLNWWGFGLCGRQAKTLGLLAAELLGHENVRIVGMREKRVGAWRVGEDGRPYAFHWTMFTAEHKPDEPCGHTSLELRWDGRWHFLDVMVGFYRRDEQGRIVSIQEIADRPDLADRPVGDPDGDMPYGPEPEIFTQSDIVSYHPGMTSWPGELPPLNLRPGESFAFLAEPIPGEFLVHPKMRARFSREAVERGPREGRRGAPPATYGSGRHEYRLRLAPEDGCPAWCRHTGDWHVPVSLPYPITSIQWQMTPVTEPGAAPAEPGRECSGFLHFPPLTGDELLSIPAAGDRRADPESPIGLSYKLVVRAPGRRGAVDLALRTIVIQNPLVVPRLGPGRNTIRLHAEGDGRLIARFAWRAGHGEEELVLAGAGPHEASAPETCRGAPQSLTLANIY